MTCYRVLKYVHGVLAVWIDVEVENDINEMHADMTHGEVAEYICRELT